MSSVSLQMHESNPTICDATDNECGPDISITAQASTTPGPEPVTSFSGVEGHLDSFLPSQPSSTTSELHTPLRTRDVCNTEKAQIPAKDPTIAINRGSVVRSDEHMGCKEVPSMTLFQGSSKFRISNTNINAIGGNATIIRFGDGQFTEIQRNLICDYIANLTVLPGISESLKKHVLTQSIISLPRAEAVFNDYKTKKKSGPCFEGTRVALLREMGDWITGPDESRMYILSGLAGIGKSTVAYTIASRAADLNLLGASFFFSREEADRKSAKMLFTTIAYQLCVYDETFAKVIGDVLLTEQGSAAITKDPQEQLRVLILDTLRTIVRSRSRPILIVIDALDECIEEDVFSVLTGLSQLVKNLSSFKVILTTRPQLYLDRFLCDEGGHKIFRLQDIEDKVVDGDIRLYLNYNLSLEKVQERFPYWQWCASVEDIESLVCAAGRLFIVASTAVRYVLDNAVSNPAAQIQNLLYGSTQERTPFKDLDHFYTVILRNVVPANYENNYVVNRYQSIVGAIIFIQHPLSVSTLSQLIDVGVGDIHAVLKNLQSVILLGSDNVPHIYHKSFPDYLTDQERCKDRLLQINPRTRHTQIATRCFEIMEKYLNYNILGLGNPACFMSNEEGLKEGGITDEQLEKEIPQHLRYACVYWINHLQLADIADTNLMNRLKKFAQEHLLSWLEVLSLIKKLDSAHYAIGTVLKLLKSTADIYQLMSDALRFISRFHRIIKRSALHTYFSALPFTPADSPLSELYRQYNSRALSICGVEGVPEKWNAIVAILGHEKPVGLMKFSLDSTLFVSCYTGLKTEGKMSIWDAATGTIISTITGDRLSVTNDFSTFASCKDKIITLFNVDGNARSTIAATPSKIERLALSSESNRVAAALFDGTVQLWDNRNAKIIDTFDGFGGEALLEFSPNGTRLAYSSPKGITLRNGINGSPIADLGCGPKHDFKFSGDGFRIASLSRACELGLWNSESGQLIGAVQPKSSLLVPTWRRLAISANGSLVATAGYFSKVRLWTEGNGYLVRIEVINLGYPRMMAFSANNILAIATDYTIRLYDVVNRSFISTLLFGGGTPSALTFSPDGTRLALGNMGDRRVYLYDIRDIHASNPLSKLKPTSVTVLALSQDCSRLACGFGDGTVELWGADSTWRGIGFRLELKTIFFRIYRKSDKTRKRSVSALVFGPDGRLFASGSPDGVIKVWNGTNGSLRGILLAPKGLQAIALSTNVLVAAWNGGSTLWSLDTPRLRVINTFAMSGDIVSIAENNSLIAFFSESRVTLLDTMNRTTIATFDVPYAIRTMTFLPDNSQLMVQSESGDLLSLDLINKHTMKRSTIEHLIQLPNTPLWRGVPIWHCQDRGQHYLSALFSQDKKPVPVLWIPGQIAVTAWAQGSSIIALGCEDGRVVVLRPRTNQVS